MSDGGWIVPFLVLTVAVLTVYGIVTVWSSSDTPTGVNCRRRHTWSKWQEIKGLRLTSAAGVQDRRCEVCGLIETRSTM